MEQKTYVKIPLDRVGVLIGPEGKAKARIERSLGVDLEIESDAGNVTITLSPGQDDVSVLFTAANIVKAVGRGFSPQRAMRLSEENWDLSIMDLEEHVGTSRSAQERVKGRIIGKAGRSREIIEELTETQISVYGGTVAIIGHVEALPAAMEAVGMLIRGSFHKTVWNYLYAYRRSLKKEKAEIWFDSHQPKQGVR
ncbi:KH domain-containing protein [Candidatus Bathyarchaeota archaeon]|nr:KH domain-containing protein [Candidatus Bathyarchaeota archaeon]